MGSTKLCELFKKLEEIEAELIRAASADCLNEEEAEKFKTRLDGALEFLQERAR